MNPSGLSAFLSKNRFRIRHLQPSRLRANGRQNYDIAHLFPMMEALAWSVADSELDKLSFALELASKMSRYEVGEDDDFSILVSVLNDDQWQFALRFCPFDKTHALVGNLSLIEDTMAQSFLELNRCKTGMATVLRSSAVHRSDYESQKKFAVYSIINFISAHSTYIDYCQRIAGHCGVRRTKPYSNAIKRIIGKDVGAHAFVHRMRNFILHHSLVPPEVSITSSRGQQRVVMSVDSTKLLGSGFDWGAAALGYIQSSVEHDLIDTFESVTVSAGRLVKFHKKLVSTRLGSEQERYHSYLRQRERYKHLQTAVFDTGRLFRSPTTIISRVIDESLVQLLLRSSLSNEMVVDALGRVADRHLNLPEAQLAGLREELQILVANRREPSNPVSYLNGKAIDR